MVSTESRAFCQRLQSQKDFQSTRESARARRRYILLEYYYFSGFGFFDFGNSDNRQLLIFNIVFIVVVEIMRRNRNRYNYPSFESYDEEQQLLPSLASATTTRKRDNELFSEQNNNNNNIDNACLFFLYCYFVFSMLPMNFYFYFLYFCFQPMQISNEMFVIN